MNHNDEVLTAKLEEVSSWTDQELDDVLVEAEKNLRKDRAILAEEAKARKQAKQTAEKKQNG